MFINNAYSIRKVKEKSIRCNIHRGEHQDSLTQEPVVTVAQKHHAHIMTLSTGACAVWYKWSTLASGWHIIVANKRSGCTP